MLPANIRIFFRLLLLIFLLHFLIMAKIGLKRILLENNSAGVVQKTAQENSKKFSGENITYDVRLGKINLGKAEFSHIENIEKDNRLLKVIKFETKLVRFLDTEIIYSDAETMLPIKVQRNISNWFKREEITENYNQTDFMVTIDKKSGSRNERLTIKKESPIHNVILLPHLMRNVAKLEPGRILIANLPNQRCEIKLVSVDEITVPAGNYKTYHFKSIPSQIEIWISADELRIPVKIQGVNKLGYSLELKEYRKG